MRKREFWRTQARPASFAGNIAIFERKPVYAGDEAEAKQIIAALPVCMIGGVVHKPTLIEKFSPTRVM